MFQPGAEDFQNVVAETLDKFQDCTLALPNLTPDSFFNAFTRLEIHIYVGHKVVTLKQ